MKFRISIILASGLEKMKMNFFVEHQKMGQKMLTIVIFLFWGTFDEQKNTKVFRNKLFGFIPS